MWRNAGRQPFYGRESFAAGFGNYDVIDPRIDVAAQRALIMMRGNPATAAAASAMLSSVKGGRLAGIYGDDLRAAAQLAERLETFRWTLVPDGRLATLVRERDPSRPPSVIFRAHVRAELLRLVSALLEVWARGDAWEPDIVLAHNPSTGRYDFVNRDDPRALHAAGDWPPQLQYQALPYTKLTRVAKTEDVPYRYVCYLALSFGNGTKPVPSAGTGVLISPRHVLTAAHCLVDEVIPPRDRIGLASSVRDRAWRVTVYPGRQGDTQPFAMGKATRPTSFRVSPAWESYADRNHDYGLITLDEPTKNGPGFWGQNKNQTRIVPLRDEKISPGTAYTAGHPGDLCPPMRGLKICGADDVGTGQWEGNGQVMGQSARRVEYDIDTRAGQSGSPVWFR